ncbi:hypothetical protein A2U01_0097715, partial [Trifolium medium]|nr:hypothetical protein [Trifolium medium]
MLEDLVGRERRIGTSEPSEHKGRDIK